MWKETQDPARALLVKAWGARRCSLELRRYESFVKGGGGKDRKEGCDCLEKPGMGVQGRGDKTMMVRESGAKATEGRKSRKEESRSMAWEGKMS